MDTLSTVDAAEYLRVSPRRVRQLAAEGRIGTRLGERSWSFGRRELANFAEIPRSPGRRLKLARKVAP